MLVVHKYGGISAGSPERIRNVAKRVAKARAERHGIVVVVSTMSDETNRLVALAREVQEYPDPCELDVVLATGGQVTIGLLVTALKGIGVNTEGYTGRQVVPKTDTSHTKARIESIDDEKMRADLAEGKVAIVAGFRGISSESNISTLGRDGSGISAVALAAALKADECQVYTDIGGVYTIGPRIVPEVRRIDMITFEEMIELANLSSEALRIHSVEFTGKYKVRLHVLSSLQKGGDGTLIIFGENDNMERATVTGIAFGKNQARINVHGVPDRPGVVYQIFGAVADASIEVGMITQDVGSEGTTDLSFTVSRNDYRQTIEIPRQRQDSIGAACIDGSDTVCKVSTVDLSMRSHVDVAAKILRALAEEGIDIQMISTSGIKVSILIDEKYMELATRVLHRTFDLGN